MKRDKKFVFLDIIYILMMVVPFIVGMVLKILFTPASSGISIQGARIYFTLNMPIQSLPITESQVNSVLVMISLIGLCAYLTHGLKVKAESKRQHIAEWIVETVENFVKVNMGDFFAGFAPFITAMLGLSAFSSLITLLGLYPPTSDLNIVAGWAVLVFILITYYKMKCGPVQYLKSFAEPVKFMTPLNIINEVATPISMAFRHYGNVLSGAVISALLTAGLQGLSSLVLGWLPGFIGEVPWLQIGIPGVLSLYFDLFSGCLQAFIFSILTMLYVSGGFPLEKYIKYKERKTKKIHAT